MESLTIWNILQICTTILAIIVFPISLLTAYLNLYPKYKDWRKLRTKEQFIQRLNLIEVQIRAIILFRKSPFAFLLLTLHQLIKPALYCLGAFGFLIMGLFWYVVSTSIISALPFIGAFYYINRSVTTLVNIRLETKYLMSYDAFFKDVEAFVDEGIEKKYLEKSNITTFRQLMDDFQETLSSNKLEENSQILVKPDESTS